ncbi:hypothetical protein LAZ39_09365 [Cereibacter sphaeroides]|nr:hypothetical protein [Cereibacter sphaeroides]
MDNKDLWLIRNEDPGKMISLSVHRKFKTGRTVLSPLASIIFSREGYDFESGEAWDRSKPYTVRCKNGSSSSFKKEEAAIARFSELVAKL